MIVGLCHPLISDSAQVAQHTDQDYAQRLHAHWIRLNGAGTGNARAWETLPSWEQARWTDLARWTRENPPPSSL